MPVQTPATAVPACEICQGTMIPHPLSAVQGMAHFGPQMLECDGCGKVRLSPAGGLVVQGGQVAAVTFDTSKTLYRGVRTRMNSLTLLRGGHFGRSFALA